MIASGEWFNPTRATGLAAYGAALVCCTIAWMRTRMRSKDRLALGLMGIEGVLLLDIAFNWRWRLHGLVGGYAQSHHEYEQRRLPQVIGLVILAGVVLLCLSASTHLRLLIRPRVRPQLLLARRQHKCLELSNHQLAMKRRQPIEVVCLGVRGLFQFRNPGGYNKILRLHCGKHG
jgi:hypothetical protein